MVRVSFMDKYYPSGDKTDNQNVYGAVDRRDNGRRC